MARAQLTLLTPKGFNNLRGKQTIKETIGVDEGDRAQLLACQLKELCYFPGGSSCWPWTTAASSGDAAKHATMRNSTTAAADGAIDDLGFWEDWQQTKADHSGLYVRVGTVVDGAK